ncbi:MAG TPA: hypothetical protein VFN02_09750 [Ktedonobacteraceae bacterium]|nr:hypothetical protein [Ktedonobacteraceae bacterium]
MTETTTSSRDRYAHLLANATVQKQATVARLTQAIAALEAEKRPVNTFTIKEVSGLDYMAYYRNPEALTLFRTHSTHLREKREKEQAKRRQSKRKQAKESEDLHQVKVEPRDPLLNYKKPELVAKLRAAYAEREHIEQNYGTLLQDHMQCGLRIARLEAQIAEFHTFMKQFRSALNNEEHGTQR